MDDLIERLRQSAQQTAVASKMMADAKTERNRAAGDADALYMGLQPSETLEWKAADEIERLSAKDRFERVDFYRLAKAFNVPIEKVHEAIGFTGYLYRQRA